MSLSRKPFTPPRRFAVARLHLPDGSILKNHVVERTAAADTYRYYPLTEEIAFTEWRGGDFYLTAEMLDASGQ